MRHSILVLAAMTILCLPARGQEVPKEFQPAVKKGLAWLVKQQKADGSWARDRGEDPGALTAFAGLALLMEGSTAGSGAYADNLNRAADWYVRTCQKGDDDGLLVNRQEPGAAGRYMMNHGYGMLFLASAYACEDKRVVGKDVKDRLNRARLKEYQDVLKRAVAYSVKAQSSKGGWFYTTSKDANDNDEGTAALIQIQALRAAQQAGIDVPKETMQKAFAYLDKLTGPRGGIYYALSSQNERPGLTAAAIVCAYGPDDFNKESAKKWLKFCEANNRFDGNPKGAMSTFELLYVAQVMHGLGDKGYEKLFDKAKPGMQWTGYRKNCFGDIMRAQNADGSWATGADNIGAVYETAIRLIVLQLDNEAVPIFRMKKER